MADSDQEKNLVGGSWRYEGAVQSDGHFWQVR